MFFHVDKLTGSLIIGPVRSEHWQVSIFVPGGPGGVFEEQYVRLYCRNKSRAAHAEARAAFDAWCEKRHSVPPMPFSPARPLKRTRVHKEGQALAEAS